MVEEPTSQPSEKKGNGSGQAAAPAAANGRANGKKKLGFFETWKKGLQFAFHLGDDTERKLSAKVIAPPKKIVDYKESQNDMIVELLREMENNKPHDKSTPEGIAGVVQHVVYKNLKGSVLKSIDAKIRELRIDQDNLGKTLGDVEKGITDQKVTIREYGARGTDVPSELKEKLTYLEGIKDTKLRRLLKTTSDIQNYVRAYLKLEKQEELPITTENKKLKSYMRATILGGMLAATAAGYFADKKYREFKTDIAGKATTISAISESSTSALKSADQENAGLSGRVEDLEAKLKFSNGIYDPHVRYHVERSAYVGKNTKNFYLKISNVVASTTVDINDPQYWDNLLHAGAFRNAFNTMRDSGVLEVLTPRERLDVLEVKMGFMIENGKGYLLDGAGNKTDAGRDIPKESLKKAMDIYRSRRY